MSQRIYLPVTSSTLARLVADGRLPGPLPAHAVTDALRREWADGDDESLEYAALMAAAVASWALREADDQPRRQVVAADVATVSPAVSPTGDAAPGDPTAVVLPDGVQWREVASLHTDTSDQHGADGDDELAWFATQEIPHLLA